MVSSTPIPTVLRIDVEPDESQPPAGERPWKGFLAMFDMVERLLRRLSDVTSHPVRLTWLIRLDPDIERAFGRTDFPVRRHHDLFDRILKHSDVLESMCMRSVGILRRQSFFPTTRTKRGLQSAYKSPPRHFRIVSGVHHR